MQPPPKCQGSRRRAPPSPQLELGVRPAAEPEPRPLPLLLSPRFAQAEEPGGPARPRTAERLHRSSVERAFSRRVDEASPTTPAGGSPRADSPRYAPRMADSPRGTKRLEEREHA